MPYSGSQMKTSSGAVVPVAWYLLNLLLLPFVGFAALLWVYLRSENASSLRKLHAKAAVCMSLLGAALIGGGVAVFWLVFGNTGNFWISAIVWSIVLHTSFVLWGMIARAQAIGDKPPYFPRRSR